MLTHYRVGRLVARIFIKVAWAGLIGLGLLLVITLPSMAMTYGIGLYAALLQVSPGATFVVTSIFACMATALFGHVALAVFDMADAARKTE